MINDILTTIMARLKAVEPNIKYLDEDWGQLDYYNDSPPVKWPCCLLELLQVPWSNQGRLVQDGLLNISVRVADIRQSNTSFSAPDNQKAKAAAIWMVLENIHIALHGWCPEDNSQFGILTRLSSRKVKRDDGIREFEVIYCCRVIDDSATHHFYNIADPDVASDQFDTVPPTGELNVNLKQF